MNIDGMIEHLQDIKELDGNLDMVVVGKAPEGGTQIRLQDVRVAHESGIANGRKVLAIYLW